MRDANLLNADEVLALIKKSLGMSIHKTTLFRWIGRGFFPKQIKITPGTSRWNRGACERRIAQIRKGGE